MSSDPTAKEIQRQTRSVLLATVASVASIALSVQFVGAEWLPEHPITHPMIATAVSTAHLLGNLAASKYSRTLRIRANGVWHDQRSFIACRNRAPHAVVVRSRAVEQAEPAAEPTTSRGNSDTVSKLPRLSGHALI
jgi:hypothetical protein